MKQSCRANKSVCSEIDSVMMLKDESEICTEGFHILEFEFVPNGLGTSKESESFSLIGRTLSHKKKTAREEGRGRR